MLDGRNFFDTFHFTYRLAWKFLFAIHIIGKNLFLFKNLQLKYFGSIVSEARTISVLLCLYYSNCCVSFSFCSGFLFIFPGASIHPAAFDVTVLPCAYNTSYTHSTHTERERPLSLHDLLEIKISFFSLPGCFWDCRSSERNFPSSSLPSPTLYCEYMTHIIRMTSRIIHTHT